MSSTRYGASLVGNVVPNAPILGARANFDATLAADFPWTHSDDDGDPQAQRNLQIRRVSDSVVVHDVTASTAQEFYTLVGGTIAQNTDFQWRVRTADAGGFGAFSGWQAFSTSAAPVVNITNPAVNGAVVSTASVDLTWTSNDPVTAYRVRLNAGGPDIVDTGKVMGNILHHLIDGLLENGGAYTATVYVWDDKDVVNAGAVRTFTVVYTAPAVPVVVATDPGDSSFIDVDITNPAPAGAQPAVLFNDVYRRVTGTVDYERIATGVAVSGDYHDHTAAHGVSYDYIVIARGANGTDSSSVLDAATLTLRGVWLHVPADPAGTEVNFIYDGRKSDEVTELEVDLIKLAGRKYPVPVFGDGESYTVRQTVQLQNEIPAQYASLYEAFMRKTVLCYRDNRGKKSFGIMSSLPKDEALVVSEASISISAVDYDEVV